MRILTIAILLAALQGFLATPANTATPGSAGGDAWSLVDLQDQTHRPFEDRSTRAIAIVFITPDCPIANYYQPTLRKLGEEFAGRGIPLFLVHSDPEVTADAAVQHADRFMIAAPVILDHDQTLARRVDARVTPEAIVVGRDGKILYRGRIDNFYEALGRKRREATEHDLRDALTAIAEGRPVTKPVTKALGCHIPFTEEVEKGRASVKPNAR